MHKHFIHDYHGLWNPGGRCDVDWYPAMKPGAVPVLVVTERPDNTNTSITNICETLAHELLSKLYPEALGENPKPILYIEAYCDRDGDPFNFTRVDFASYKPIRYQSGKLWRHRLGSPTWKHMLPQEVTEAIKATGNVWHEPVRQ